MDDSQRNTPPGSPQWDNTDEDASQFVRHEVVCAVCRTSFPSSDGSEAIPICRECKDLVSDGNETTPVTRNTRRRSHRRGRSSRYDSSESIEDLFSQQFSELIGLVRHNHDTQAVESPFFLRGSRRLISDYDSESIDHGDSFFGETNSNISFYGGYSEASQDAQYFANPDYDSHNYTDTDIDPMHARFDQWNSDDEEEWEGVNMEDSSPMLTGLSPGGSFSAQNERWIRVILADLEESNTSDYVDARGFEEVLEQFVETDSSRRGAPPAAASAIKNLPIVIVSKDHEKNSAVMCPVCKDTLVTDTEAMQLPCQHMYHPSCILPWLSTRNSCPVCRYELPTDDVDYEMEKRNTRNVQIRSAEGSAIAVTERRERGNENTNGGRGWIMLAAAPIVGIVGIALALWFKKCGGDGGIASRNGEQRQWSRSAGDRNRRWLFPF